MQGEKDRDGRLVRAPLPDEEVTAEVEGVLPGEAAVARAARRSIEGEARGLSRILPFLGPAFIAAVAYVDPGNFATNITAGSQFGYLLLWVVLAANLMAMVVQTQSAKLGIATGMNLPEACRETFRPGTSRMLWVQAEVVAMATDVAEIVGAALALNLLFGIPLFPASVIAAVVSFLILLLQQRGFRRIEAVIIGFVGVIFAGFAFEIVAAGPDPSEALQGLLIPGFSDTESILLASGIIGATVMPHVVYLHSALTQRRVVGRDEGEKRKILRFERVDVVIAMALAGLVNLSMMAMAAALFFGGDFGPVDSIEGAFEGLKIALSDFAAVVFGVALLASGFASASVGTMSGQVVMQGFIRRRIPLFVRRTATLLPALVVIGIGLPPTEVLVVSQVILSFGIPFALVPLLILCRHRGLMGGLVNPRWLDVVVTLIVIPIIALNAFLLLNLFF
ncbi:MAG: divalent metal cation transporter [Solirubrobacterales bacterium]|nr:divalent metal cation transporter [Solirubrobacterales bacterium]